MRERFDLDCRRVFPRSLTAKSPPTATIGWSSTADEALISESFWPRQQPLSGCWPGPGVSGYLSPQSSHVQFAPHVQFSHEHFGL